MKGMDMKGMDMKGMDMKGMEQKTPTAAKSACDRLKSADMNDPLMQALAQKCREQTQPDGAQGSDHSGHAPPASNPSTPRTPPTDGQPPGGAQHH